MKEQNSIGVDVSKSTLDIAVCNGEIDWKGGHTQVSNDEKGYAAFLKWTGAKQMPKESLRVCMEYTGIYCHRFRQWLESEGIIYYMVNPMKMHRFEVPENVRGFGKVKTDKVDAYRIAIYCLLNRSLLKPGRLPSATYFKLKMLLSERRMYVTHSLYYKQQRKEFEEFDTELAKQRKAEAKDMLRKDISAIDAEMKRLIQNDEEIRKNYDLLLSITGIGHINAITAIVMTENFHSISNPRQYANYIGVAPFKTESGTSVRGKTKVSKAGFSAAKADLTMAAMVCVKCDQGMQKYWQRKKAEGKSGGCVQNAIKFKLICRIFAVIRRQTPYVTLMDFFRPKEHKE